MSEFIDIAQVNILNGVLKAAIPFKPRLNIISGENGTLKTKLLQELKAGRFRPTTGSTAMPRILAISPKRNSERRAVEQIFQRMRQENRTLDRYLQERGGAQINDTTFENYSSIGELFFFVLEVRARDGGPQVDHMNAVTRQFNEVIGSVFPDYRITSEWDPNAGIPRLFLVKKQSNRVPIEALSTGEQEVLSLITNLYASRDAYDVFLIDEPEVHLNWHLEDALFRYLNQFSEAYQKQIIVSTHSRIVFKDEFLSKTIFLFWNDQGRVSWDTNISPEIRRRIAGETIEIIKLGDFSNITFFVEDNEHKYVIEELARVLASHVSVTVCGNAPNVRSLFCRSKADGGWENTYFVEDGDNQNSPFPGEDRFLHLSKYCIENYLLDVDTLSSLMDKTPEEVRAQLHQAILRNKDQILGKNKFLEFLLDRLTPTDLTDEWLAKLDASIILPLILQSLGMGFNAYLESYVQEARNLNLLKTVFPDCFIQAIAQSNDAG